MEAEAAVREGNHKAQPPGRPSEGRDPGLVPSSPAVPKALPPNSQRRDRQGHASPVLSPASRYFPQMANASRDASP